MEPHNPRLAAIFNLLFCLSDQEKVFLLQHLVRYEQKVERSNVTKPDDQIWTALCELTDRQQEVLVFVARGYTRREISHSLGITMNTASTHISNIYSRLGITSKAEATRIAIELGLLRSMHKVEELNTNFLLWQ